MSNNKVVTEKRSFANQWFAVTGSIFALSIQPAHAAGDRHGFNEFRNNHPNLFKSNGIARAKHVTVGHAGSNLTSSIAADLPALRNNGVIHSALSVNNHQRHQIRHQTVQDTTNGALVRLNSGVDLDLSASDTNITLGQNLFNTVDSVTIMVGNEQKTVSAGSQVSSAEYVAVKQVMAGGVQKVIIDGSGRASGGEIDLNAITGPGDVIRAANLVIPENVTTFGVFNKGSEFRLTGDLDNHGSLYALSNGRHGGTLHADDITNRLGALISTVAPDGREWQHSARNTDLSLQADGEFVNMGSIVSGGSISIAAGAKLSNSGRISSRDNVTLGAQTINNSGTVSAQSGDIALNGSASSALQVDNQGGQLAALNGAISLHDKSYAGTFDTHLSGGSLLSKELNINAGNATAYVDVGQLTGTINQTGSAAHLEAATDDLNIGKICLTGDPTFRNTIGNINITGNITVAESLVIAAAGDITSNNSIIITAGDATQGYPITLIAGVNFIAAVGGSDVVVLPPLPAGSNISLGQNSLNGGSIKLGNANVINARSTDASGNDPGGAIHLFAFRGASPFSGNIDVTSTTLNSSGKNNGSNGDIEIIAGGNISVGTVIANGFNTATGDLKITTAQPFPSNGGLVMYNTSGLQTSLDSYVPGIVSSANGTASLFGSINASSVVVKAGGNITSAAAITTPGSVTYVSEADVQVTNVINADIFSAKAGNNFTQPSGTITAPTIMFINATNNITNGAAALLSSSLISTKSSNGKIGLNAASRLRVDAGTINITSSNGSAFLLDVDDIGIIAASVAGTLDVNAVDALTIGVGASVVADVVNLRSTADAVVLDNGFIAGTSANLHANTDIVGAASATAVAPTLSMTADSANIGSLANPIHINANNIVISTPFGGASVTDPDQLNFGGGPTFVATNIFAIASGSLSSTSSIIADFVFLSGGTLNIAAPVIGTSSIGIISSGNLTNANITGGLSAPNLLLSSTNGNIGTSANNPLTIDANTLSLSTTTGSVFVSDPNSLVLNTSIVKNTLNVKANGDLSVVGDLTSNNADIILTATKNTLSLADNTKVNAVSGITLLQSGTNKSTDKIKIGVNSQIVTSAAPGDVVITVGVSTGKAKTKPPKNVAVVTNTGKVLFFGKKVMTAAAPVNTLTAKSANVIISNSLGAANLTLGGNVIITADPPVPEGSVDVIRYGPGHHAMLMDNGIAGSSPGGSIVSLSSGTEHGIADGGMVVLASDLLPVSDGLNLFGTASGMLAPSDVVHGNAMAMPNDAATLQGTVNTLRAGTAALNATWNLLATIPATVSVPLANLDDSYMTVNTPKSDADVDGEIISDRSVGQADSVNLGEEHRMLDNGNALLMPSQDITVATRGGTLRLAAGSVVFVSVGENHLSVYDLEDRHKNSVVVEVNGRCATLSPGRHCTITGAGTIRFADVNPIEKVGHRSVVNRSIGADKTMFMSEFSLPSAMLFIRPLRSVVKSDRAEARKIKQRLMKTCAILMQIGGHAPYELHARPRVVALNR